MKKIFRRFMILAALGVVGVSCEKSQIAEDVDTPSGSGAVLHVANLTADTRVDFEDKGTDGSHLNGRRVTPSHYTLRATRSMTLSV